MEILRQPPTSLSLVILHWIRTKKNARRHMWWMTNLSLSLWLTELCWTVHEYFLEIIIIESGYLISLRRFVSETAKAHEYNCWCNAAKVLLGPTLMIWYTNVILYSRGLESLHNLAFKKKYHFPSWLWNK